MSEAPARIVVLGTGVAGAMAGAALGAELPRSAFEITLVPVRGEDDSRFGAVEATDPSLRRFHARLGIDDTELVRKAGASFTLGVAYAGWSSRRPAYFSPFGDIGAPIDGVAFHQLIARARDEGHEVRAGDFSLATLLAQGGRFCLPSNDPASPLSTFSYGLHIDGAAYASVLKEIARRNGAEVIDRPIEQVERGGSRAIEAVVIEGGESIAADFVVDASAKGIAISGMEAGWESWRRWLPCDRIVHSLSTEATPPLPYSIVEAHSAGWKRSVGCQGRAAQSLAYSSDRMDEAAAEQQLGATAPVRHVAFDQGRRTSPWSANCVAIGPAAFLLDPLHPGPTQLIFNSIERLLRLFPGKFPSEVEAREYNRETNDELDRARDFAMLRYLLNGRAGEPFWDEARSIAPPPELERKLAIYRSRGIVPMLDGDMFDESEWALLLDEHDVRPRRRDVLADAMPIERLVRLLNRMRELLIATAAAQPSHGEFLAGLRHRAAA